MKLYKLNCWALNLKICVAIRNELTWSLFTHSVFWSFDLIDHFKELFAVRAINLLSFGINLFEGESLAFTFVWLKNEHLCPFQMRPSTLDLI